MIMVGISTKSTNTAKQIKLGKLKLITMKFRQLNKYPSFREIACGISVSSIFPKNMGLKYGLFILLLTFCACSTAGNEEPPTPPGGDDSSSVPSVEPMAVTLPRVDFNELSKIKKIEHSKAIVKRLIDLIDATPKGAPIYLSPDCIDVHLDGIIDAIRRADIRGVELHIMLDMSSPGNRKTNAPTIKKLKLIDSDMNIVEIRNRPDGSGVNHNKFDLFSKVVTKTGESKNVVFTTSMNMFPSGETRIQNAITLSDSGLYEAYLSYWQVMKQLADNGNKNYTFRKYSDPDNGIYAFFYPKTKDGAYFGPDPIVNVLNKITDPSSTTIQIPMAGWSGCRMDIVKKLSDLMDQGANVEVVTRSISAKVVRDALANLVSRGAFIKILNSDKNNHSTKHIRMHTKVMLIRGEWKGNKTNVIIAGSENYNCPDIHQSYNNNIILSSHNFKHPTIFKRYEEHFNKLKKLPGICCMTNR